MKSTSWIILTFLILIVIALTWSFLYKTNQNMLDTQWYTWANTLMIQELKQENSYLKQKLNKLWDLTDMEEKFSILESEIINMKSSMDSQVKEVSQILSEEEKKDLINIDSYLENPKYKDYIRNKVLWENWETNSMSCSHEWECNMIQ